LGERQVPREKQLGHRPSVDPLDRDDAAALVEQEGLGHAKGTVGLRHRAVDATEHLELVARGARVRSHGRGVEQALDRQRRR
jgi:hypothetical protein